MIRYLDERSHISKNVCQVHLVVAFMPTGQTRSCQPLELDGQDTMHTVSWNHNRILHSGVECSEYSESGATVHTQPSESL